MNTVFITGSTGLLGRSVVMKFLQTDESVNLKLLVRAASDRLFQFRTEKFFNYLGARTPDPRLRERVEVIQGDITLPHFGLSDEKFHQLARRLSGIVHMAASTRWDSPLDTLRKTNTIGTQHVAELARLATRESTLKYYAHISTAYVAGDRRGVIRETELWEGQDFNNNYERSKFEAEMLVQQMKNEVPVIVFRPSMIIGDSQTGETPNFNVFYYLVKLCVQGRLKALPTRKSALIDMVPSDYVANAIHEIINQKTCTGNTFHLCSGRDRTPTMSDILDLMTRFFAQRHSDGEENLFRCPKMLNPTIYKHIIAPVLKTALPREQRRRLKNVELYIPYTSTKKIFDTSNTAKATQSKGLCPPLWREYYTTVFQYCVDADWNAERIAV